MLGCGGQCIGNYKSKTKICFHIVYNHNDMAQPVTEKGNQDLNN